MDFSLSEDQRLLKESVERFVGNEYSFETRREIVAGAAGFSPEIWAKFAELGWLAMPFPEEFGGLDGSPVDVMVLMEVFGAGLVAEPYLASIVLGGGAVLHGGSDAQKSALLPALAKGKMQLALAYAEEQSRYDPADVETRAEKTDGGYVLSGRKIVAFNAEAADRIVVSARTGGGSRDPGGITLFLVERGAAGLSPRGYGTVDGGRAADLTLDGVRVADDAVLGAPGDGLGLLDLVLDHGAAAVCAEAVGAMQALNDATLDYLKTREQFGVPIGKFQALQHRMADMFMAVTQARAMAAMAAMRLGEPDTTARKRAISAAKVAIGRAGRLIGQEAVQMHGGIGMTDELAVSHYFKRVTMIDHLFGDKDYHLRRFADLDAATAA
ncbi:MAG: acyl-CoA dehydrogenase family protein [Alphaproteobacteria bacterium]